MTEQEAIEVLVTQKQCIDKSSSGQCKINCGDCKKNIPIAYQEKSYEVAITALKEVQQYREMDKKLREAYGDCDGLLAIAVEGLCKHPGINIGEPIKARLLIDEDVDKWDAYREIGTVEECREAVDRQKPKKHVKDKYHHNCCSNCGWIVSGEGGYGEEFCPHCENCGQAIQWDENLEEMEDD